MIHDQERRKPHHQDILDAKDQAIGGTIQRAHLLRGERAVCGVHHQIQPLRAAIIFAVEQLDRLHAPDAFHEVRGLLGGMDDLLFIGLPKWAIGDHANQDI